LNKLPDFRYLDTVLLLILKKFTCFSAVPFVFLRVRVRSLAPARLPKGCGVYTRPKGEGVATGPSRPKGIKGRTPAP